ncbi:lysine decarboxylase 1 [Escherichia coli]|nr:lysine decarboxylase 1 [Escherichia coli]
MNVIAILNHMGVYFKEEPIRELHRALERLNFQIVYPNDRDDLLKTDRKQCASVRRYF